MAINILDEPYEVWQQRSVRIKNVHAANYPTKYLFLLAVNKAKGMTDDEVNQWQYDLLMKTFIRQEKEGK